MRKRAKAVEEKLIAWRRDIHQHPELGDQETRTSQLVAEHLRGLGLEVRTGVASERLPKVLSTPRSWPLTKVCRLDNLRIATRRDRHGTQILDHRTQADYWAYHGKRNMNTVIVNANHAEDRA